MIELLDKVLLPDSPLEGKVFVDTSTVHPNTSVLVAQRLGERGAKFIAAPVFGASPMASAGKLIFAMAGPTAAVEKTKPLILNVMGQRIIEMGDDVAKSSLLKISGYGFPPSAYPEQANMYPIPKKHSSCELHGSDRRSSSLR